MYNSYAGKGPRPALNGKEGFCMKRLICLLLAVLAMVSAVAMAEGSRLSEAVMIYEDYDGNHAEQTIDEETSLNELEWILLRASKHPAELQGNTMNCTLLCMLPDGGIYDFAIATDGSALITDMTTDKTYAMEDGDLQRFWELFDIIDLGLGYDANFVFGW